MSKLTFPGAIFNNAVVQKVGKIDAVLSNFLDSKTAIIQNALSRQYPQAEDDDVERLLKKLATSKGTKRPLTIHELLDDQDQFWDEGKLISFFLDPLKKARIIRQNEITEIKEGEETKRIIYELTHDTLAKRINEKRNADEIAVGQVINEIKAGTESFDTTGTYLSRKVLQTEKDLRSQIRGQWRIIGERAKFLYPKVMPIIIGSS